VTVSPCNTNRSVTRTCVCSVSQVEHQLSAFIRHLFISSILEIALMMLAILYYYGETTAEREGSHDVFLFVFHFVRCVRMLPCRVAHPLPDLNLAIAALR